MAWRKITCEERERIVSDRPGGRYAGMVVLSSKTDLCGEYGPPEIVTEWGDEDETPILRDFRFPSYHDGEPDRAPCEHYAFAGGGR